MAKENKVSRCRTCSNLDKEKSNENWIVCKFQPLDIEVVLKGADVCKKYETLTPNANITGG